jgi:hypothetical protein
MLIHAFVRLCMVLNPMMCVEQEIIPWDYRQVVSVMDCAMGGMIFMSGSIVDRDGMAYTVKGIRCASEGSLPTTEIQARLRASLQ